MNRIRAISGDRPDEDEAFEVRRILDDEELSAKRAASGLSPEQLSLQDAFLEGQRAAGFSHGAAMNPFQDGTPEHGEWERGRLSTLGMAVNKPCRYVKGKACDCGGRCTCVDAA